MLTHSYPPHPYAQSHPSLQPVSDAASHSQQATMAHPQPSLFQDGSAPVFRACASAMQRPTLTNVRIRSTRDAHQIFYAVLRNLLPMTVRRLDAEERRAITSGNVYVWEERGASSEATGLGIERWTDGMRWSPSRVRDEFLFYHQKEMDPEEAADLPPTRWARVVRPKATGSDGSSSDTAPDKIPHQRAVTDPEKLIKQTYSVLVALPEERQRGIFRKWHLTAYFTQSTVDKLSTVDELLPRPHVMVPEGLFRSARAGKIRRDSGVNRQQQQRQIAFFGADASMPSGSLPSSAYPPSASSSTFSPPPAPYAAMTPHAYQYPRSQLHYSAYVQDELVARRPPLAIPPPAGASYAVPALPPPPPPQGESSINSQGRGHVIAYARPSREWFHGERERVDGLEERLYSDRERVSPRRIPRALPNTYDPARGPTSGSPLLGHSPPRAHPYANAMQAHFARAPAAAGVVSGGSSSSVGGPSVSQYYSPAKPIEPIEVPASAQTQSEPSPASASSFSREKPDNVGTEVADEDAEMELGDDEQRQSSVGPVRVSASPSPRHRNLHLASVRPNSSPRSQPRSVSEADLNPRPASASGSNSDQTTFKPSPAAGRLTLDEERVRSLVPLDSLENALFPRRDPTDDALLRRFNALRTTPPSTSVRDE